MSKRPKVQYLSRTFCIYTNTELVIDPRPMSPPFNMGGDPIVNEKSQPLFFRSLASGFRGPNQDATDRVKINPENVSTPLALGLSNLSIQYIGWCTGCMDSTRDECGFLGYGKRCAGCAKGSKTGCLYYLPSKERRFR